MHLRPILFFWPRSRGQRGSALLAVIMVVAALVTFLSIAALATSQFGRYAGRQQGDSELMAAADSGLEYLYAQWQKTTSAVFNQGNPPVTSDFAAINATLASNLNSSSQPFAGTGVYFTNATITLAKPDGALDNSASATGTKTSNVPNYPGWTGTTFSYIATVTVTPLSTTAHFGFFGGYNPTSGNYTNNGSFPRMTVTRMFQVTRVPLFQAAIFYENKLEIHPGADMTVTGLVHTNGDLWARGFNNLTFQSNVSYVGSYHSTGDSSVTKGWDGFSMGQIPGVNAGNNPMPTFGTGAQLSQVSPIDPFGGADQSDNSLHKIIDPNPADTTNNQLAYNNASLIIKVDSTPGSKAPITITDGNGNSLSRADQDAVMAAVTVGSPKTTFYDQRETTIVTATSLDMSKLANATVAPPGATTGPRGKQISPLQASFATNQADPNNAAIKRASGTVYIYDTAANTNTNMPAIRLINGSVLGQDVTVASNNPVYIQGDYNTGGTGGAVKSNKNGSDGTDPTTGNYNRYSSAVMADAVTILSNSWTDGASALPLYLTNKAGQITSATSNRVASPTTVNTAILAGDLPSNYQNNQYASGGAHNFPRFLENWNNVNFTYYGSLVEAFRSTVADSHWQTNQVYYWPNRRWWFDTNFMTTQPPGVPKGISYSRGRWTRTNG